jgi:hypothetical protein
LPNKNELEFGNKEQISNSEKSHPIFMLNLNKYQLDLEKNVSI